MTLKIDQQILIINGIVGRHIENLPALPPGVVSQDILSQL